jgi:hypothetical protein
VEKRVEHLDKSLQAKSLATPHKQLFPRQSIGLRAFLSERLWRAGDDERHSSPAPVMAQCGQRREQVTMGLEGIISRIPSDNRRRQSTNTRLHTVPTLPRKQPKFSGKTFGKTQILRDEHDDGLGGATNGLHHGKPGG